MNKKKSKTNTVALLHPFIFIGMLLSSCVHHTVTTYTYKEDITPFRPVYQSPSLSVKKDSGLTTTTLVRQIITPIEQNNQALEEKLVRIHEKNKTIKYVQGYRILAYSGTIQEMVNKTKEIIYELFPDENPEVKYVQPNFKVKVGEFYERQEANSMYIKLKKYIPDAVIISERVTIRRDEQTSPY